MRLIVGHIPSVPVATAWRKSWSMNGTKDSEPLNTLHQYTYKAMQESHLGTVALDAGIANLEEHELLELIVAGKMVRNTRGDVLA